MEVYAASGLNYVVTAHKPTAVIKSVAGYFTGPKDLNLIVAKSTRLEVHVGSPQGIEAVLELPIYGRISNVELFRPRNYDHDLLFVFLEKYKYCVLEYNTNTREVDTLSMGDAHDQVGRPSDSGQLSVIDPLHRCIVLQMYDGMLKIIPMDSSTGRLSEAFNTRLDELQVLDIAMLANKDRPMVSVLYQDNKHGRHLKSFQVSMHQKILIEDPARHYSEHNLDPGAGLLVPVPAPLGGLLVLGEESILYVGVGPERPSVRLPQPCILKAWGRITADGSRVMLSDNQGLMYILLLQNQDGKVTGLKLEIVGRTSSASSLSYLDDGVVYVGSRQGDSQLIRLHANPPDPSAPNSYIQVLQTWPNLGPIVDFSVMDLDRQGQGQLVCCSGVLSDGSLRVVRNGVGINEQASIELTGIRGLWSLRGSYNDPHHKYLVLTFVEESRILAMSEDQELDEVELPGFEANAQTLWCGNTASDLIVQVTSGGVRAIAVDSGMLESVWRAEGDRLDMAAGNATQVVVASKGGRVKLLGLGPHGITQQAEVVVEGEVACVDITPTGTDPLRSSLVAVGTWGMAVQLYAIQQGGGGSDSCQLQLLTSQLTGGDAIPRSIMMWCFEDVPYLLVGLGDGQLHYWRMQATTGSLHDKKKLVLGSKPVMLRPFKGLAGAKPGELGAAEGTGNPNGGQGGVFAASDRPAVLYSSHKKILFANLNENEVTYMAPFNCQSYPDSLALAKEGSMTIGTVDAIRKLHIHTVPLQEQPRRIAYQEETHTLGVVTITNFGMEDEANFVRAFDAGGVMELKADFQLAAGEVGQSICSCKLGDTDTATYYVVGTGLVRADEAEPKEGRLLVLQYTQGQLVRVSECKMKGSVYEVLPFHGGRLLSTCNNKVQVHRWIVKEDGSKELQPECSAAGHIVSLCLAARGDHVIVGDLMRSIGLYLFKPQATATQAGALELRAQDYATNWCTAVAMLDDDTYLGAENSHNLFVVRKSADAQTDEERGRLELVGEFHWGEYINRIRPGSLVLRLPDSELAQVPTWLFGTIDGSIGVIASLPPHVFEFLTRLQDAMRKVIRGVGGLSHAEWRRFENERKTAEAKGFVDGDLIELFLDLKPEDATKVVSLLGEDTTVEEVTHKVEELARLH